MKNGLHGEKKRFGDVLVEAGLITREELAQALKDQQSFGGRLGTVLFDKCLINEKDYMIALSAHLGIPSVDLKGITIPEKVIKLVSKDLAWQYMILPVSLADKTLTLAMADPTDQAALEVMEKNTRFRVKPAVATENAIRHILMDYYDNHYGQGDYRLQVDTTTPECRGADERGRDFSGFKSDEPSQPGFLLGEALPDREELQARFEPTPAFEPDPQLARLEDKVLNDPLNAMALLKSIFHHLQRKGLLSRDEYLSILKNL